jgi:folate-binding protein YgfZ
MNWIDFLAQQGACNERHDFGDPEGELLAARSATVVCPLADLGLIRASGEDIALFLNNLLTNDVKTLPGDGARRSGICNAKGRLLADFLMWHGEGGMLLALSAELLPAILKKLSMYVLRAKVKLTDASEDTVLLGLSGPNAAAALAALGAGPAAPMTVTTVKQGRVICLGGDRHLLAVSAAEAESVWLQVAHFARPAGLAAWHWLEIVAGIPCVRAATQEQFVPQMVNFELIGGVSFNKGCYPGQEIVARTQYLGKIKRRMFRARIEGTEEATAPGPGAHLFAPETGLQACGTIVLAAPSPLGGFEALAVVQSSCQEAGEVHLDSPAGPRLSFLPLPYEQGKSPGDEPA